VTEGRSTLRAALHLSAEQLVHWRPVESALRAAIRERAGRRGLVRKVRIASVNTSGGAIALQRAYSAAGR